MVKITEKENVDIEFVSQSVNITREQKNYLEDEGINFSGMVREFLDGKIETEDTLHSIEVMTSDVKEYIESLDFEEGKQEILNQLELVSAKLNNIDDKLDKLLEN